VLDVLSSLVRKSLVAVDFGETDARYRLLESTRAYASEMAQTEAADLSERHAAWVMAFVQETSDLEWTMPQQPWLARIEAEIDNIRLALGWASRAGGRPCILPRIVGQLGAFWNDAGLRAEGRRWLTWPWHRSTSRRIPSTPAGCGGPWLLIAWQGAR
jgi:predicted ATPase